MEEGGGGEGKGECVVKLCVCLCVCVRGFLLCGKDNLVDRIFGFFQELLRTIISNNIKTEENP